MRVAGSCHCKAIRFVLRWPASALPMAARQCGCDFCRKHGGVWTSHPEAVLEIAVRRTTPVSRYRFGTETADFWTCSNCGVVPLVTSMIDDTLYAVVSVNAFDDVPARDVAIAPSNFDGEDTDSRLQRRKKRWIPAVSLSED